MRRVPDPLRAENVDSLVFSVTEDGRFRIVPEGLYDGWRPSINVEGRGRIVTDATRATIQFEVGVSRASLAMLVAFPTVLIAIACYNLLAGQVSPLGFWGVVGFAALSEGVFVLRARSLIARAWPGLLVTARRLAEGSLYVPGGLTSA